MINRTLLQFSTLVLIIFGIGLIWSAVSILNYSKSGFSYNNSNSNYGIKPIVNHPKAIHNPNQMNRYWKKGEKPKNDSISKIGLHENSRFLVWEPWSGGFNNERMSLELAFCIARVENRILVMPPPYNLYLIGFVSFYDFFNKEDLYSGVQIIEYAEFVDYLHQYSDQNPDWIDAIANLPKDKISDSLERISYVWNSDGGEFFNTVFAVDGVPSQGTPEYEKYVKFVGRGRDPLSNVDPNDETQKGFFESKILFIRKRVLLGNFYTSFYFNNSEKEMELKNSIKYYCHYTDELLELADRISSNMPSSFSTLHLRRGDFQYTHETGLKGDFIFNNVKVLLKPNEPLYIATDERNRALLDESFYNHFRDNGHEIYDMSMFLDKLNLTEKQKLYMGVIDQLMLTRGRVFIGTRYSTFSSFAMRIRGYSQDRPDIETYFTDTKYPEEYFKKIPIPPWYDATIPLWGREWKTAWTEWDKPLTDGTTLDAVFIHSMDE